MSSPSKVRAMHPTVRKEWEELVSEYPQYLSLRSDEEQRIERWRGNRDKVAEFFQLEGRKPSLYSEDPEERRLACWLQTQIKNYKTQQ